MSELTSQISAHKARRQRFEMAAAKYSDKQIDDKQAELLNCWILPSSLPPIPNKAIRIACEIAFPRLIMNHIEACQRAALREFPKVTMLDLKSERRTGPIVAARQVAMYVAKKVTAKSLPDIGRRFNRDHTTVLHAIRRIEKKLETDQGLASLIEHIIENIPEVGIS